MPEYNPEVYLDYVVGNTIDSLATIWFSAPMWQKDLAVLTAPRCLPASKKNETFSDLIEEKSAIGTENFSLFRPCFFKFLLFVLQMHANVAGWVTGCSKLQSEKLLEFVSRNTVGSKS